MHKMSAGLALAFALLTACGGSSKPTTTPTETTAPAPSPCIAMAAHMKDVLLTESTGDEAAFLKKAAPGIERVLAERCQADAWSPEVVACATTGDNEGIDACLDKLDSKQQQSMEDAVERELKPLIDEEMKSRSQDAPTEQEAPGSPPPPAKGAAPKPDDPCGGGA